MFSTILVGIVNLIATFISIFLMDRWGRRKLLLFSQVGVALSLLVIVFAFASESSWVGIRCGCGNFDLRRKLFPWYGTRYLGIDLRDLSDFDPRQSDGRNDFFKLVEQLSHRSLFSIASGRVGVAIDLLSLLHFCCSGVFPLLALCPRDKREKLGANRERDRFLS